MGAGSLSIGNMRIFFGIPVENRAELAPAQKALASTGIRLTKPENIHITFIFLGEVEEEVVGKMCESLTKVKLRKPTVKTGQIIGLPQDRKARVIALKLLSPELESFYYDFAKTIGFRESRRYMPHITLARCRKPVPVKTSEIELPEEIEVDRMTLFRSTLTPEGPVYKELCKTQFI